MGLDEIRDGTANGRVAQCLICELDWQRAFQGQLAGTGRTECGWTGGGRGATRVSAAGVRRNKRCRGTRADAITMAHNSQHAQKQIAGRLVRLCEVVGVRTI
ncbi:hypothetical protein IG631_18560 [Alternaria alternata]|jgi:hypothetical protein|nr:hypothetical protein IG631_18560 [Alternaria alternata]